MDIVTGLASRSYATAQAALRPHTESSAAELAGRAADSFAATLQKAETTAAATLTGDADPHALVDALAQSQLAVETAVSVRNKVVEAYQEILRMPV